MLNWLKGLFNLEECKYSTIMFAFILFCSVAIYEIKITSDVPQNLANLIMVLGGYIVGINAVPNITNLFNKNNSQSYPIEITNENSELDNKSPV